MPHGLHRQAGGAQGGHFGLLVGRGDVFANDAHRAQRLGDGGQHHLRRAGAFEQVTAARLQIGAQVGQRLGQKSPAVRAHAGKAPRTGLVLRRVDKHRQQLLGTPAGQRQRGVVV